MVNQIESIPEARLLLMSLRSVGYTEETAIADIIDNSISAHASEIDISFSWNDERIVIADNGIGMTGRDLVLNMRIGSADP
nr:ATP-binding protein [Schwartzia sp. (in: firmicutes)]